MDAVTERMLERARARQAKVDAMKDRSKSTETTIPLRENNRNKVTASTSVDITKGANNRNTVTIETTVTMKRVPSKGSLKNNRSFDKKTTEVVEDETTSFEEESETEEEVITKENVSPRQSSGQACGIRQNVKSQLKRLGQLYSDGDPNLSSPIHRTEETFTADDKYESTSATKAPTCGVMPSAKPARTARLAALANAINQWEDDLSHPTIGARTTQKSPVVSKHSQFGGNSNKITAHNRFIKPATVTPLKKRSPENPTPSTSSSSLSVTQTVKRNSMSKSIKQKTPDKNQSPRGSDGQPTLTSSLTLKQTVKRNSPSTKCAKQKTPEKLHSPSNLKQPKQKRKSPPKSVVWDKAMLSSLEAQGFCRSESNKRLIYEYANQEEDEPVASSSKSTAGNKSPEKASQNNRFASPTHAGPMMGVKQLRSPRKTATTSTTGSVRDKAAQYEESTSPTKRATDPAELPLSERLALFEKNKGSAILPKAPFATSVPIKHEVRHAVPPKPVVYEPPKPSTSSSNIWQRSANKPASLKPSYHHDNEHPQQGVSRGLTSRLAMFEKSSSKKDEKDHMKEILMEREKEMQMLKNRWNRKVQDPEPSQSYSPVPPPPPMPPSPPKFEQRRSGFYYESDEEEVEPQVTSPKVVKVEVEQATLPEKSYPGLSIKPVKISPPKPGRLYPCLSDMDTESEVPESDDYSPGNDRIIYEEEDSDDSSNSFGQKIKEVAERHSRSNLKRDWYNNSDQSETEVMNEIDDFLDEALGADSSGDEATPPKRSMISPKYGSQASHSFEYSRGCGTTTDDEQTNNDTEQKPLLHTVSFYRKQQTLSMKPTTPSRQVQIDPSSYYTEEDSLNDTKELERELEMIDEKIHQLEQEVTKQSIVIQQASQALNLCYSTIEFSGSTEQVEAEKHLLVATIKRQAALHEIQRLKIECSLRPQGPNNKMLTERGSVTLSRITLPLKLDIIRSAARDEQCYYLVCLIRCGEKVLATNMMSTLPRSLRENNKLTFPNVLTLDKLYSDFKITVEVYAMTARSKEVIPHDIKYHIGTTKKEASKLKLTPKKNKGESRLVMPVVQSPGGPNVVRTSAFNMIGYVIFSLREIQRTQFTLNKVAYTSVLEGSLHIKLDCEMSVDVVHRGFLTMFEDISGFGAWHRRWCLLNGDQLSYWKYPDDERKKIAIDTIELSACTTDIIGPVTRDLCARPNTFLLETARPARSTDLESLVLMREGNRTINRHLLSADTKEERAEWCAQLNKALALMRAWGKKMPTN